MKRERRAGQGREVSNVGTEGMGQHLEVDPDRVQGRRGLREQRVCGLSN